MKPNYKNWIPRGMVIGVIAGAILTGSLAAVVLFTDFLTGGVLLTAEIVLGILFFALLVYSIYCVFWYRAFSYYGKKQIARRIIEKVAQYVVLPENGKGLDIGCGSGALTIACAKNNSKAQMVGLDRCGEKNTPLSIRLCAKAMRKSKVFRIGLLSSRAMPANFLFLTIALMLLPAITDTTIFRSKIGRRFF